MLRDALAGLGALSERQAVIGPGTGRADVLALAYPQDPSTLRVAVGLLRVEDGEVRQTEPHLLEIPANDVPEPGELLRQFLTQYYGAQFELPDRIYIAAPRPAGIDATLDELFGPRGVEVHFRPTGRYASLGRLAERLARATVDQVVARPAPREVLLAVQSLLELPTIPNRIEGVDISLFQGSEAVGSLVVFERGLAKRSEYRRYRIRTVEGTNDFAMVAEVVSRRFARRLAENEILPDLLLIDGGAGQLSAATGALAELGLADRIPTIGLAKREEEVYRTDRTEPMHPNPNAAPMLLLRAVRRRGTPLRRHVPPHAAADAPARGVRGRVRDAKGLVARLGTSATPHRGPSDLDPRHVGRLAVVLPEGGDDLAEMMRFLHRRLKERVPDRVTTGHPERAHPPAQRAREEAAQGRVDARPDPRRVPRQTPSRSSGAVRGPGRARPAPGPSSVRGRCRRATPPAR